MNEILLFGAGASKDAGLPDAYELTGRVLEAVHTQDSYPDAATLSFVVGSLLQDVGASGRNPLPGRVDIELLFRALERLELRRDSELAPFVSLWHPRVFELEEASRPVAGRLGSDATPSAFGQAKSRIARELGRILWRNDHDVDYLDPLVDVAISQRRLVVGTLNYDNVVEVFCKKRGVTCATGLSSDGYRPVVGHELTFCDEGLDLIKLHGSMNWSSHEVGPPSQMPPHRFVVSWGNGTPDYTTKTHSPGILFGGGNKLTAHGPFLKLFQRFQDELMGSDRLTVVGYSFRDDHVNTLISEFLLQRPDGLVVVVDPRPPSGNLFFDGMVAGAGQRVALVKETASAGLKTVFTTS